MQTRRRAKAETACCMASGHTAWLPEDLQLRVLDLALRDYAKPIYRNGLVANPARNTVDMMLVCRVWRSYIAGHQHACHRQVAASCLRIAWLTDAALLTGISGQPKRTKLNKIPNTVRLLVPYGGGPAATLERCSCGCGVSIGGPGDSRNGAGSSNGASLSPHAPAITTCPITTARKQPAAARWVTARVLRRGDQRSAFERDSFPERVPLLALETAAEVPAGRRRSAAASLAPLESAAATAASEPAPLAAAAAPAAAPAAPSPVPATQPPPPPRAVGGGLTAGELRWLLRVVSFLDAEFLCPLVLRLSDLPPAASAAALAGASSAGVLGGGAAAAAAVTEAVSGAGVQLGGAAASGVNRAAARSGCAAAAEAPPGSGGDVGGGVGAAEGMGVETGGGGGPPLTREDVGAMASASVAVGHDGRHTYLLPTAATLRRTWVGGA